MNASATREAEVRIVAYDASWPAQFEEERARLFETIGPYLAGEIEHIGSTAIPGMSAKAVIDIMAGVEDLESSRPALELLASIGYCYYPYREQEMHWLCKPSPEFRTHHLHLVPLHSSLWVERLSFRDILRAHPEIAAEYEALKRNLADEYRFDREAYTEGKSEFVRRVIDLALR